MKIVSSLMVLGALVVGGIALPGAGQAQSGKIMAQKVVEEMVAAHPEITSLELAAVRSQQGGCRTIAATEGGEVGEKCDKDEYTAVKSNKPLVMREKDGFEATVPLHDSSGKIMATAGMDFKLVSGQTKQAVLSKARQIALELEKRFPSRPSLFARTK